MKSIPCLLGLASLLSCSLLCADESRTVRYDWFTAGNVSGSQLLQIQADGGRTADFEFNDRGRGPKIHEEVQFARDGSVQALQVSGSSYMGAPVDESFRVADGTARWQSTLESGEAAAGPFYLSNDGTPEQQAVLARALLAAPEQQLELLPAGHASIQAIAQRQVSLADEPRDLTLYAVNGLDLTPQYLWLDSEQELFALTLGWMGLAPQGWGEVLGELQQVQDQAEQDHLRGQASELTESLPDNWILRNVNVVDLKQGKLLPDRQVVVQDGRILRVVEGQGPDLPVTGDLQPRIIDGQGQVLIPGLWDMHTHLSLSDGLLQIAAGVTTARDLGNEPERLADIRAAFDAGEVIGPRVYAAGFIDRRSPYSAPTGRLADSQEQALAMVREYAAAGYPQVKIYSSIEPEWVKPIATEVHANGMRLSGHIPSYMTAQQAVLDGFDEIQHINMLFLNFLVGPEDDTRTPLRFSLVAERAGSMDLGAKPVSDFIVLLRERGTVVDPTVTVFDSMFRHRSGELDPSYAMIADHMPPEVRRGMLAGELDITDGNAVTYARSAEALLGMIGNLHAAGVTLVAGTDAMPGFTLHRELELYVQAGIPAADVLRIATLDSARVMGAGDISGSIAPGRNADFVLLAGNPIEDISAVRRPVAVFKGDRWYDPARLYEAVGIRPFTR